MDPKGTQTGPKDPKMEPQGPPSNKKNDKCIPRVSKWSPRCYNGVLRFAKLQKKHKKVPRNVTEARNCAAKNKQTNKQKTNKQTNKHTNKHPNNKTTSFALQTQTQTPAAGCSPKATYIRRGAFSTLCRRVGTPRRKTSTNVLELTKSIL